MSDGREGGLEVEEQQGPLVMFDADGHCLIVDIDYVVEHLPAF